MPSLTRAASLAALAFSLVLSAPPLAAAAPSPLLPGRSIDFRPNPAFRRVRPHRLAAAQPGIEQVGEVVILEGDDTLVSSDGMGGWGILYDFHDQQPPAITSRFFTRYPDEFDEIVVFTSFQDGGAEALAYEISVQQDVRGIGSQRFDDTHRWGSRDGRLHAFVNMMRWNQFQDFSNLPITDPRSSLYATLGQEFAHRWLSFLRYKDAGGQSSKKMLGRDGAHWASTLQADASVMDGNRIVDNGDGSFTVAETFARYSPLDLYAMGLVPPEAVPPFFLVNDAVSSRGNPISPSQSIRVGTRMTGTREDISIEQVIAAEGARLPSSANAPHDFRVAIVLVTRPGERASDVLEEARTLDEVRRVWERVFVEQSGGAGSLCTQVSAPCGGPTAHLLHAEVEEATGNHNRVLEPGEVARLTFQVLNDSTVAAEGITVHAPGAEPADAPLGRLLAGNTAEHTLWTSIPAAAPCGEPLLLRAESEVDGHRFPGFAVVHPGLVERPTEGFERGRAGWQANRDGTDTATNGWAHGTPATYRSFGWTFQPSGGYRSAGAWFTGLQPAAREALTESSLVGTSRLWSAPMDLRRTFKPQLRYQAWFQGFAFDANAGGYQDAPGAALTLEGSGDGGATWVVLDVVEGSWVAWRARKVSLEGKIPPSAKELLLRFTVTNPSPEQLVEAGIDDVQLTTLTLACNPDAFPPPVLPPPAESGCAAIPGAPSLRGPLAALALLALLALALAPLARPRRRRS